MASFIQAMNTAKMGVKGADVYTEEGVGDRRVALFQQLVRGCTAAYINEQLEKAFAESKDDADAIRDYVVMAFQARDIRGGKGERDIFYAMIEFIAAKFPHKASDIIRLIPEYGCWVDCWHLWSRNASLRPVIGDLVKWIFFEDLWKLENGKSVSLLAKWIPREKSKFHDIATEFATKFYPDIELLDDKFRAYRQACSKLNKKLDTTEVKMCGNTWADIKPASVPGKLLSKSTKAFLNETKSHGLRYPDSEDRMACREHFIEYKTKALKGEVKMKGADVVYPHNLVEKYLSYSTYNAPSADEDDFIEAQWRAIRDDAAAKGKLGRAVAMSDFSGSMAGTPMAVSMALGLLISEVTHPAFRGNFLAFDTKPYWINVSDKATLKEKVHYARKYAQGLSTNFLGACKLILDRMIECKVPVEDAPEDLIVLTDMGFDAAMGTPGGKSKAWETHLEIIRRSFELSGYKAPRIVLWNLRAEYKDFHAKANEEGVCVLSGWSPSILKAITSGKVETTTPYQILREVLDDARYDAVRKMWDGPAPAGGAGATA